MRARHVLGALAVVTVTALAAAPSATATTAGHREVVTVAKKKKHHKKKAKPAGPIFFQAGNGTAQTGTFKVPSDWDLAWSYDCTGFAGGTGNFIVSIYDYYGQNSQLDLDNDGVNQLGAKDQGVDHYHSGGNKKYLKIDSECSWGVTVTKGKSG